jgi:VWFA-related protein
MRMLMLGCVLFAASACFGQQPLPSAPAPNQQQPAQPPQTEQQANPFPESESEAAQRQAQQQQQQAHPSAQTPQGQAPQGQPAAPGPNQPAPKVPPRAQYFPADPNLELPTFRVSTSVVVVPTLVEQKNGDVLYGLKPTDFSVYDNGVEQKIHVDDDLDSQPVSLVVCVERGRDAPMEFDKIAKLGPLLTSFIGDGHGEAALVAFDSQPVWVEPFTADTDSISRSLGKLPGGDGGASILDAVGYSVNLLEQQPPDHRRVLLLISESRDHGSHRFNVPELVERIGTSNTLVLSLVFSPSKAELIDWGRGRTRGGTELNMLAPLLMTVNAMRRNTPKTLASLSGGEYAPFTRDKGFEARVVEEASHARNRYILSFHPTDPTPGLHAIQVILTQNYGARIVARNSYWAIRRDDTTRP